MGAIDCLYYASNNLCSGHARYHGSGDQYTCRHQRRCPGHAQDSHR